MLLFPWLELEIVRFINMARMLETIPVHLHWYCSSDQGKIHVNKKNKTTHLVCVNNLLQLALAEKWLC